MVDHLMKIMLLLVMLCGVADESASSVPRFTDNADGTVTDNQAGLIWLKDADCFGTQA